MLMEVNSMLNTVVVIKVFTLNIGKIRAGDGKVQKVARRSEEAPSI